MTKAIGLRRPEEILSNLNQKRFELLNDTEQKIAAELEEKYAGKDIEIFVDGNRKIFESVMENLVKRFSEYGWFIEITNKSFSSQKDGDRTCFLVSGIIYPLCDNEE